MKKLSIGLVIFSLTFISASILGGITLFGFNFTYNKETPKVKTSKEKQEDLDIELKKQGESAIEAKNYQAALQNFLAISNESTIISNKAELVDNATKLYLSDIFSKVDNAIMENDFEQAKNLIDEAETLIATNEKLSKEKEYVYFREKLYSLLQKEDDENAICFIKQEGVEFSQRKEVADIYASSENNYLDRTLGECTRKMNNHEYDVGRKLLKKASELLGNQTKIKDKELEIDKSEVKYKISLMKEKEEYLEIYQYVSSLSETLKNDNLSDMKWAKGLVIADALRECDKYLEIQEYNQARQILETLKNQVGDDKKIEEQFQKIDKKIVKDTIDSMREKKQWRELIDYLNSDNTIKKEYNWEYQDAVNNYKTYITYQVQECIESEDKNSAYNILETAKDILDGDVEFEKLYKKIEEE